MEFAFNVSFTRPDENNERLYTVGYNARGENKAAAEAAVRARFSHVTVTDVLAIAFLDDNAVVRSLVPACKNTLGVLAADKPLSAAKVKALFKAGQTVIVTNHFITREDHPCFGTKVRVIEKVTGSHLWFKNDRGELGNVPWPKAAGLRVINDTVEFRDFPKQGDLFLTFHFVNVVEIADVSPDFLIENHGTIFVLQALTPAGHAWVEANLPEDAMTFGGGIVVEHRYIQDIAMGIVNDGLVVR